MNIHSLKNEVRYLTNEEGEKTDVLIPLTMWENILQNINSDIIEDNDDKAQLIADLKQSLSDAKEGKTFPLAELWHGIEL